MDRDPCRDNCQLMAGEYCICDNTKHVIKEFIDKNFASKVKNEAIYKENDIKIIKLLEEN